jgi:hypothetical protein
MSRAMTLSRVRLVFLTVVFATGPLLANRALAGNEEEARAYLDKATAAYALNKYAVAAENFEKAFELKPDPALLYNAAQAWRLAGNKERALALYESYLRVYPANDKRSTVEARIKDLKASDRARKSRREPAAEQHASDRRRNEQPAGLYAARDDDAPGVSSAGHASTEGNAASGAAGAGRAGNAASVGAASVRFVSSNPTMLTQNASPPDNTPLTKKPLFWVGVGGGVVAVTVVVLLLTLGGGENPASASLGRASGN